ncbi:hypothetical protein TKK_0018932 [Trichogramma kaykai]|uniref:Uncharacterized protein n=1 Tax=Trichogramma kaykai TaxID=54128 RepID=A0ABD2VV15_9HYME
MPLLLEPSENLVDKDDDFTLMCGRIIIFSTCENSEVLFRSPLWYVDGTFSTVPSIFFQMFALMGSVNQEHKGVEQIIVLPLMYALMEGKKQITYAKTFEISDLHKQKDSVTSNRSSLDQAL